MDDLQLKHLLEFAESAIQVATDVRRYHAKRTKVGSSARNTDITHANNQLRTAMVPIRSALGRWPYEPKNTTSQQRYDELIEMSHRLQNERRKLWKLRNGGDRKRGPRGGKVRNRIAV